MKTILHYRNPIIFVIISFLFFVGCKKDFRNPNQEVLPDLSTKVTSKLINGFVTDENNLPVQNATVEVGFTTVLTDKYGYFEFHDATVIKNSALVTVTKDGYFKGIKTYIAESDKSGFFRIKLILKTIIGNFSGSSGGSITTTDGMSIDFSANSIMVEATKVIYTGVVNVAAYWINPGSNDLVNVMPGDLRGLNLNGSLQLLTTYGMAAVELTGAGGELLQIASDKKATLSFPLPTAFVSAAPLTIPLWYFDETIGLWKEEGMAIKSGNSYVGEVNHFSFWNCDVPNSFVQFNCTLINSSGNAVQYAYVKISVADNPINQSHGYTDLNGFVRGAVPNNSVLHLQVFSNSGSNTPCYSKYFTTSNTNINLGNIIISTDEAYVTGTVTGCNNIPVTNGSVYLRKGTSYYRHVLSNSGSYSFAKFLCEDTINYSFTAVDHTTMQQSNPINYTLSNGTQTIPNIKACGISASEYFYFKVDGVSYGYAKPNDEIVQIMVGVPLRYYIKAYNAAGSAEFFFEGTNMSLGSQQPLVAFNHTGPLRPIVGNPIDVNITEYGSIGEYVTGNFSGSLIHYFTNVVYNVSGNFRIKRIY